METQITVKGMDCENEIKAVKLALSSMKGVSDINCNLMTSKIGVTYDNPSLLADIEKRIESTGLEIVKSTGDESESVVSRRGILVFASGIAFVIGFLRDLLAIGPDWISYTSFGVSLILGGYLVVPKALRAIRKLNLDMNVLMTVAVAGAVGIGEYSEGAAVVFLFALAEWLEGYSVARARKSIQSLLKIVPETALVIEKDGSLVERPVSQVSVGQMIRVRSGSRIPIDGVVTLGRSAVNQAPITGESLPVEKSDGDRVLAGSINGEGSLDVTVTQGFSDTKIAQIIRLLEDAQKQKAPTQRFVDEFAKYYTPTVFVFALGVFFIPLLFGGSWQEWLYRSLVLLVIACPCALVIATPVSIVAGLTAMARKGVLIKGGAALEAMGKLRTLAVDKTGTITEGIPKVLSIYPIANTREQDILRIAAAIDVHSTHPLARAVVAEANSRKLLFSPSLDYRSITGRGAEAVIDGHTYFVGNHRFAHEFAICSKATEEMLEIIEDQAQSVVVVGHRPHHGCAGEILGVLGLGDAIRADAKSAIDTLHEAGIQKVIMLSGDNKRTVDAISKRVGIDEAYGDLLPDDKVLKIKELKKRFDSVAMIGDGVNDAPAMATATLGIAMGAGTDTAIETSDVTLMQDRLTGITDAIKMGKRTMRVICFNTGFALATKSLFLVLSLSGHSSLWLAVLADTGATLIVIANSLRLLR